MLSYACVFLQACTEVDDEGFFEGLLRGKRGLVPSNMVELITDPEKLGQVQQLLVDQQCRSPGMFNVRQVEVSFTPSLSPSLSPLQTP